MSLSVGAAGEDLRPHDGPLHGAGLFVASGPDLALLLFRPAKGRVASRPFPRLTDEAAVGSRSYSSFRRAYGSVGEGTQRHHAVEQTSGNVSRFGPEVVHNMQKILKLDIATHGQIQRLQLVYQAFTGGRPRDHGWVVSRSKLSRNWAATRCGDSGALP